MALIEELDFIGVPSQDAANPAFLPLGTTEPAVTARTRR
jgi:hypothetical protein